MGVVTQGRGDGQNSVGYDGAVVSTSLDGGVWTQAIEGTVDRSYCYSCCSCKHVKEYHYVAPGAPATGRYVKFHPNFHQPLRIDVMLSNGNEFNRGSGNDGEGGVTSYVGGGND